MAPLLPLYKPGDCEAAIRNVEHHDSFLKAVLQHLDRASHRTQMQKFLSGKSCNLLYVAAGIRHIFAHGKLTPNSGVPLTVPAQEISTIMVDFLFRVMDGEFIGRLRANGIVT